MSTGWASTVESKKLPHRHQKYVITHMSWDLNHCQVILYEAFSAEVFFWGLENDRGRPKKKISLSYQDLIATIAGLLTISLPCCNVG